MPNKSTKTKTSSRSTAKRSATPRKSPKKTSRKKATKKKASSRKSTKKATKKKASSRTSAKTAAKKTTKKKATKKTTTKKKTAASRKSKRTETSRGLCTKKTCASKTCGARRRGGSLIERARDCQNLEECRQFIHELTEAVDQANDWLNEMHSQALSAEQTRDLYAEQISDLLEAIDMDRARIAALEADLKKARKQAPSSASDAVLRKLSALSEDVQQIRADLERMAKGSRTSNRRGSRKTARATKTQRAESSRSRPPATNRRGETSVGPFAKYSVLRGAACSLGVGKHGYPPEVCAPAYFDRSEAAEILGTYAQNDYGGLAKWALITGFPVDDGGRPVVPRSPSAKPKSKRKAKSKGKATKAASQRTKAPNDEPRRRKTTATTGARSKTTKRSTKVTGSGRSSQQILDQVLLTVARI